MRLLNPNLGQKAQPILAHHFADLRFRPACVLHRGGQIGKVTDSAHPRRVHDLAERTGRDYSVGAVYTTLQRLEDKGLLTSRHSDPLPVRGGRSRRHFSLTGAGARALREAERHAASIWAGVRKPLRPNLA